MKQLILLFVFMLGAGTICLAADNTNDPVKVSVFVQNCTGGHGGVAKTIYVSFPTSMVNHKYIKLDPNEQSSESVSFSNVLEDGNTIQISDKQSSSYLPLPDNTYKFYNKSEEALPGNGDYGIGVLYFSSSGMRKQAEFRFFIYDRGCSASPPNKKQSNPINRNI